MKTDPTPRRDSSIPAESPKILVVDDEDLVRSSVTGYLSHRGLECLEAENVPSALEILDSARNEIGVVLSDLRMPGQSGLDLLSEVRRRGIQDLEFIIMTGYADTDSAVSALRHGATDFLSKPVDFEHLFQVLRDAKRRFTLHRSQRDFRMGLIAEVKRKASEIRALTGTVDTAYEDSVRHLATAAEFRDSETGAHIWRIGAYSHMVAGHLGWSEALRHEIELASPLHDIGKIGIPDSILMKKGALTDEEFATIKEHSMIGHKILSVSDQPVMMRAAEIALSHHERWDGSGYPAGLQGTEILIASRVVAICDVYDALRSPRPYKPAFPHDRVVGMIMNGDGRTKPTDFDPDVLEILTKHHGDFADIYRRSEEENHGKP